MTYATFFITKLVKWGGGDKFDANKAVEYILGVGPKGRCFEYLSDQTDPIKGRIVHKKMEISRLGES